MNQRLLVNATGAILLACTIVHAGPLPACGS